MDGPEDDGHMSKTINLHDGLLMLSDALAHIMGLGKGHASTRPALGEAKALLGGCSAMLVRVRTLHGLQAWMAPTTLLAGSIAYQTQWPRG